MSLETYLSTFNRRRPLHAPYAFAPISPQVLPSPLAGRLDHSRPMDEAIGGAMTVRWRVETPILVGGADNAEPFSIKDRYGLPGATLRGLIRSVVEIAAYGRLTFYDDFVGYTRDMIGKRWRDAVQPSRNDVLRGGWLFEKGGEFHIIEADARRYEIDDILTLIGGRSRLDWHSASLHERLDWLSAAHRDGFRPARDFGLNEDAEAMLAPSNATPPEGQGGDKEKRREALFLWPEAPRLQVIAPETGKRFLASLTRDSNARTGHDPAANFNALIHPGRCDGFDPARNINKPELQQQLLEPRRYGLPVFWRNRGGASVSQAHPDRNTILSLTAFLRVPYQRSLTDIAARTQRPRGDALDLAQALFGWAPGAVSTAQVHDRSPQEQTLRGRVDFGFAWSDQQPRRLEKIMAPTRPSPSFWPFYLRAEAGKAQHPVDYDNDHAILAGRKPYPARQGGQPLPTAGTEDMTSTLTFLEASPENPIVFESEVRVHNVTRIELGALVWALTFGQHGGPDRKFRHMLGRAKAFGYGQTQAQIIRHGLSSAVDGQTASLVEAQNTFRAWVTEQVGAFEDAPEIEALLSIAHAPTGAALRAARPEALDFIRIPKGDPGEQVLKAYVEVKQAADHPPRHGQAGEPVAQAAEDEAFIGLPPYPKTW